MKGELLKEFLSRILVEDGPADELNDIEITYTDKDGKERKAKVISIRKKGSDHPAWPKYQALLQQRGIVDTDPSQGGGKKQKKSPTDGQPQSIVNPLIQPTSTGTTDTTSSTDDTNTSQYCSSVGCSDTADYFSEKLETMNKDSNPELYDLLKSLEEALRIADKDKLQETINKYGCYISQSGKFVCDGNRDSGKIAGGSIEFNSKYPVSKFTATNRDLGMSKNKAQKAGPEIQAILDDLGVEYVNKGKPITSESLKQSRLYRELPAAETNVTLDETGRRVISVKMGDHTHTVMNMPKMSALVTENKLNEIKKQHPDWTEDRVNEKVDRVRAIIAAYNQKIKLLAKIADGGIKMLPLGQEGQVFVAERIKESFKDREGNPVPVLNDMIDKIARAESPEGVVEGWQELARLIGKDGDYAHLFGDGSIPILVEHIETMYQLSLGRQVPVIMDEAFTLVDVVSLSTEPIDTTKDIAGMVKNIDMIEIAVDTTSVKRNMGAASAVGSRIGTTQFYDPTGNIKKDLNTLGASEGYVGMEPAHRRIYSTTEATIEDEEARIVEVVKRNMENVRAYYGFSEESPTDDDIIEGLKKGLVPVCGKFQKGEQSSFEKPCPPGSPISELNRRQMQLYSLSGFTFDAIYNRNVQAQSFSNVNYTLRGRNDSDGVVRMARSQFQFNKKMKCRNGQMRDEGIQAKLKNVPGDEMKTICPSKKTKKK